jgi:hypothetical protein
MLDGIGVRREVLVLVGAVAADPRRGIEEEIEFPKIADALGQAAMAVGVGVDQAGNDQAAAGVDDFGIGVPHCPGRDNVGDEPLHVGYHLRGICGAFVLPYAPRAKITEDAPRWGLFSLTCATPLPRKPTTSARFLFRR